MARQTVSKWEAGTTVPTVPGWVKLAEVLQTDCNSLLAEEEKQTEIKQTETGYVVDWTKLYPILVTYQQEMDCAPYEAQFAAMIREVQKTYGYSAEDAMLALKDIFAKTYFKEFQPVSYTHLDVYKRQKLLLMNVKDVPNTKQLLWKTSKATPA